jgi:hypothetical protein
MNSFKSRLPFLVLVIALMTGMSGCVGYYHEGPPVYKRAHYHHPYHYYYYPSVGVYFHIDSGRYYYHDRGRWHSTVVLPVHLHLDHHDRVRLWSDSDKPYLHHDDHHHKYKPSPHYRSDPGRDRDERQHNKKRHEEYHGR